MFSEAECNKLKIVKYLIQKGIDFNLQKNKTETALMYAATSRYIRSEKLGAYRVKIGNDVYSENYDRENGVIYSSHGTDERLEILKYLVEKGADIQAKNNDGKNALMFAKKAKNRIIAKYLEELINEMNKAN